MFQAYSSRWRAGLLALGALGFVVLGLWFVGLFGPDHPQGFKANAVGWFSISFFGACAVLNLFHMRARKLMIQIDASGVLWRQWSADQIIPWDAIARIGVICIQRQKMLGVDISAEELAGATAWRKRLGGANRRLVGFPVCLAVLGTDRSFSELLAAVERHAPAHLRKRQLGF